MNLFIASLRAVLGDDGVLTDALDIGGYRGDLGVRLGADIECVVRPRSCGEVSTIVRACAQAGYAITPRGGGTGLVGGATPLMDRSHVVLSFERMREIRSLDPIGNVLVAEAGCPLQRIQEAAHEAGRLFGLDHGGAGSSQIGGNLSTNAGGSNVLRYGMARQQVLGLELVLADGTVLNMLRSLPKNNAGYDLNQLFLGSEGTLGLITAASLRLRPAPVCRLTSCLGLRSAQAALSVFVKVREAFGELVSAFELMPRAGLELHFRHAGARHEPFEDTTPWLVLIEVDCATRHINLGAAFEELFEDLLQQGLVLNGILASSEQQRQAMWRLREGIAVAMIETPGALRSDTAVPVAAIPAFLEAAGRAVESVAPNCLPVPFGHIGDGNIHYNVLPPNGLPNMAFETYWPALARVIEDCSIELGGTVSAEHGIGSLKRAAMMRMRSSAECNTMARIKRALDPTATLNPGKILQ